MSGADSLTLLIPGLRCPPAAEAVAALPPLPALTRALARADRDAIAILRGTGPTLVALAGLPPGALPAGALTARANDQDGTGDWIRIDPVHLAADAGGVRLMYGAPLAIDEAESDALTTWLSAQLDAPVHAAGARYWYTAHPQPDAELHPLDTALGTRIGPYQPHGAGGSAMRKWLNEVQMLLHQHPVNQRRTDHGEPAINSVWPWGAGALPDAAVWPFDASWADEPAVVGLAALAGTAAEPAAQRFDQADNGHRRFVLLPAVFEAGRLGAVEQWLDAMARLERDWFAPAVDALAAGRLGELTVHDGSGARFTLRPPMRWRVWRRRTLHELLDDAPQD